MRDQLRPLEGQLVVFKGRATEKQRQADGLLGICLAAVEVRPHRTDTAMRMVEPIKLDHAWIRGLADDDVDFRGLLRSMAGVARVTYYRRSDGSVDLGLRAVEGVCLDNIWKRIKAEPRKEDRAALMASAVDRIEEGSPYWSWWTRADQDAQAITKALNKHERSMALNLGAVLAAPSNGPCTKMRAADPFTALRRGRKEVA